MKTKMRNTLVLLIGLGSFAFAAEPISSTPSNVLAQDAGGKCFNETTHIVNIGIGTGGISYFGGITGGSFTRSPAIIANYEHPWPKKLGIGYLGVGGYLGYQRGHYRDYSNAVYHYDYNYTSIAARGVYHFDVLNFDKGEVYCGALVGLRIHSYNSNDPNTFAYAKSNEGIYPIGAAFAGARWYFAKNFALYGEAGSGVSFLTGGVSFKF